MSSITESDVRKALQVDEVDIDELLHVLYRHFNKHRQERNFVECYRGDVPVLRVSKSKRGRLVTFEPLQDFSQGDLSKLAQDVRGNLIDTRDSIGRTVLFSYYEVTGTFEIPGLLQILPLPPEAPAHPIARLEHPFVLEFAFSGSTDREINETRCYSAGNEFAVVLNCILEGVISEPRLFEREG